MSLLQKGLEASRLPCSSSDLTAAIAVDMKMKNMKTPVTQRVDMVTVMADSRLL